MFIKKRIPLFFLAGFMMLAIACSKKSTPTPPAPLPPVVPVANEVDYWLTKADQSAKIEKQSDIIAFNTTANGNPEIVLDSNQRYQSVDGFGFTLTGGSATLINQLDAATKQNLLQELFNPNGNGIRMNYIRLSIGASDLSASTFTYNDLPAGQTDPTLAQFSLLPDRTDLIPLLKEIIAINPNVKLLACPWSAPVWMKDNGSFMGGSLQPQYYSVYAQYFV
ncbi:MAG: glycoside hydrolase family 30 protein, partial [Ferruginibacter sp.]